MQRFSWKERLGKRKGNNMKLAMDNNCSRQPRDGADDARDDNFVCHFAADCNHLLTCRGRKDVASTFGGWKTSAAAETH